MQTSDLPTTIVLQISHPQKQTLDRLAADRGLDLSDYLLEIALEASTPSVPEAIVLSPTDWQTVTTALDAPAEANAALKAAIGDYRYQYGV
jgi:uncharacterized protein (DUF1778 family)